MARARNIKPGFFRNADLAELSFECRLLFIGLWTIADRNGRLEDRPKQVKMEVFPGDSIDVDLMLECLHSAGFIVRYLASNGRRYIWIRKFLKHQNPHVREPESAIPAYSEEGMEHQETPANTGDCTEKAQTKKDENCAGTKTAPVEHGASTGPALLIPDPGFLIPDSDSLRSSCAPQGEAPEPKAKQKRASAIPADFEPNETCISLAAELGVPLGQELPKFRDHHSAKGTTMKDWQAAFRTWLRNAKQFARPSPRDSPAESRRQQQDDWLNQLIPGRQQKRHDDERTIESTPRLVG